MHFPQRVKINEVVLRDGLQLEAKIASLEEKKGLFDELIRAGVETIEFGSFVHPKAVPQMANSGELYGQIADDPARPVLIALIPNLKGAELASSKGVERVNFVFSASNTHNQQNVNKSTAQSLEELEAIHGYCKTNGIIMNVSIATSFGCPFEGDVPPTRIHELVQKLVDLQIDIVTLADTTGMANPRQVFEMLEGLKKVHPGQKFNLHFHNTRGMGLANILSAIQAGADSFDTSLGGLGGCPFAPGATGNVCTEDAVHMLQSMGIETGISLEKLIEASKSLEKMVGHKTPSYILKAGPSDKKFPVPKD
ncbi:MAG TPA: hydroxymethylglutaryl-CoA lyase [Planococcus sp. (in: firmicutes)]|nr:hydroxymethylglutaryl-CoA lyase [Planococcus sp. (in: firmicutes)]